MLLGATAASVSQGLFRNYRMAPRMVLKYARLDQHPLPFPFGQVGRGLHLSMGLADCCGIGGCPGRNTQRALYSHGSGPGEALLSSYRALCPPQLRLKAQMDRADIMREPRGSARGPSPIFKSFSSDTIIDDITCNECLFVSLPLAEIQM